jgi:glycosyltransferase involved in cell wall biosynthesis
MYGVKNLIVAHPEVDIRLVTPAKKHAECASPRRKIRFFYPAFPRVFKNIELLLKAAELVKLDAIEIWLTFSGETNRYARTLVERCRGLPNIKLLGRLTREQVFACYDAADCLVFPSRLETWGLPISEFKQTGKPMLVADLPYAHETVGSYEGVHFFDPENPGELASLMRRLSIGELQPGLATAAAIEQPFAEGWRDLFEILLQSERC